ncbi:hypothetical protein GOP47_0025193 [Adiantum capillus-veneris]|uniref:Uncharacterized protein n=1 Tax=Adiantum capillus-veneris TaxID=13818 RepID=A0A9D4Z392_ADICA|nr:hypothetical protein GOP47_0025193 [Adiantum capillus-veneris]
MADKCTYFPFIVFKFGSESLIFFRTSSRSGPFVPSSQSTMPATFSIKELFMYYIPDMKRCIQKCLCPCSHVKHPCKTHSIFHETKAFISTDRPIQKKKFNVI